MARPRLWFGQGPRIGPAPTPARAPRPSFRARAARRARRAGAGGLAITLGAFAMLYAFQTRLIFPGAASQGDASSIARPTEGAELLHLKTADGSPVAALFGPALTADGAPRIDARDRPTLLYFYGNGYNLARAAETDLGRFRRFGVNVLIPDYLGYGMSGGAPSETGCYATADAAYAYLKSRPDVNPAKIVAGGRSLGGAVALDLAAREPVAAVFAFCTFTSMADMTARKYPFLPASLLLRHKFATLEKIGRVRAPVLLGHGAADSFVPPSMSRTLAERAPTVRSFEVLGADHNDFYEIGAAQIAAELRRFFEAVAGAGPTPAP